MDHLFKLLAHTCGLNQSQYWHLRLLSSVSLVPLLAILYLVFFDRRARRIPPASRPNVSLWVNSDGRLIALPE